MISHTEAFLGNNFTIMTTLPKNRNMPVVRLGSADGLNMIGYNVDTAPGDVVLPIPEAMKILFKVFDKWETRKAQQASVLGISPSTLVQYRKGKFPQKITTINRVEDLLRIELMLNVLIGQENPSNWITSKNIRFDNSAPIEYMSKYGTKEVKQYLEYAVYAGGW